jgi:glycosyltransferase involved in cell wall biosynthesis
MLFKPNDPKSLAEAVIELNEDSKVRLSCSDNARREFEGKYTAEANYRQLIAIYNAAIVRHQGSLTGIRD